MNKQKKDKCGRWKKTEHDRFMKALEKYGKNWPLIQKAVKTRTLSQVRSHAQKLFLSMTTKDMKQLNCDLDERFELFCKSEDHPCAEGPAEKRQESSQIIIYKQEEPCSTIHKDQASEKRFFKDVLIFQNKQHNEVFHVKVEETEKKVSVKAQCQAIEHSKGAHEQNITIQNPQLSQDYCFYLPPWAMYFPMYEALSQLNSTY